MTGEPTTVRLTLELELHQDPVTGTITSTDDGTRAFTDGSSSHP
jgi:hypothetical protein